MEYGLIGARLGHSFSKPIHEAVGGYPYELHPLPTEAEVRAFFAARAFCAVNVTIPYKQVALACCDEVDPRAAAIGAVNTVVNRGGRLYGYNTDYDGFAWLARAHGVDPQGRAVMILGSGATRKTLAAWCRDGGAARVDIVSRRGGPGRLTYAQVAARADTRLLLNATPAGMYPNNGACLLDPAALPRLEGVLDVVYNPFASELVLRARDAGVPAFGGLAMLVAQAVYAAQHFTGRRFDVDAVVGDTCRDLAQSLCSVSLIGMPGSGKSTLGRRLAKRLGKTAVDVDTVIERRAGMPIPEIFAREGEAGFRRREAEALAEVSREPGRVIACGGGIVKTPGNLHPLRQNGPVLWLRRPVEALPMNGRPLSSGREALRRMEAERTPLYAAAADAAIDNTGTLEQAADAAERAVLAACGRLI